MLDLIAKLGLTGAAAFILIRPPAATRVVSAALSPRTRSAGQARGVSLPLRRTPPAEPIAHAKTKTRAALRLEGVVRLGAVLLIAATQWRSARSSDETLEHLTRS
jgi:hypothetical protein